MKLSIGASPYENRQAMAIICQAEGSSIED